MKSTLGPVVGGSVSAGHNPGKVGSVSIAIVADTHLPRGRRRLPEECVRRLRGADLVVHAGDFVSVATLAAIEELGPPVVGIHGNVDCDELARWLPASRTIEIAGATIAVTHDSGPRGGRLARLRRRFPDAGAVIFGHSHAPLHERDGGFQIFNPGSPTERRRAPRHTMGLARVVGGEIAFEHVELD